jgi:hypothetical protein
LTYSLGQGDHTRIPLFYQIVPDPLHWAHLLLLSSSQLRHNVLHAISVQSVPCLVCPSIQVLLDLRHCAQPPSNFGTRHDMLSSVVVRKRLGGQCEASSTEQPVTVFRPYLVEPPVPATSPAQASTAIPLGGSDHLPVVICQVVAIELACRSLCILHDTQHHMATRADLHVLQVYANAGNGPSLTTRRTPHSPGSSPLCASIIANITATPPTLTTRWPPRTQQCALTSSAATSASTTAAARAARTWVAYSRDSPWRSARAEEARQVQVVARISATLGARWVHVAVAAAQGRLNFQ